MIDSTSNESLKPVQDLQSQFKKVQLDRDANPLLAIMAARRLWVTRVLWQGGVTLWHELFRRASEAYARWIGLPAPSSGAFLACKQPPASGRITHRVSLFVLHCVHFINSVDLQGISADSNMFIWISQAGSCTWMRLPMQGPQQTGRLYRGEFLICAEHCICTGNVARYRYPCTVG